MWDSASGAEVWRLKKKAHDGHVTALEWWNSADGGEGGGCFVSGGQDGCVRVSYCWWGSWPYVPFPEGSRAAMYVSGANSVRRFLK